MTDAPPLGAPLPGRRPSGYHPDAVTDTAPIDAYLAALPEAQREQLQDLRGHVAREVPDAVELISYDMPAFKLDGQFLISYAGWKKHCSLYPTDEAVLEKYSVALEGHGRTKGSLHFSKERPLPEGFLGDLIRARVAGIRPDRS
ncbi:MAG: hypothetical protein QOH61_905 [Chloroflexota bacterium]|nr:hypothetical protein [Chloroflexota bacterium]